MGGWTASPRDWLKAIPTDSTIPTRIRSFGAFMPPGTFRFAAWRWGRSLLSGFTPKFCPIQFRGRHRDAPYPWLTASRESRGLRLRRGRRIQFGTFGSGDISAWFIAEEVGLTFTQAYGQPHLAFKVDASSGDDNPNSPVSKLSAFFTLGATTSPSHATWRAKHYQRAP